MTRSSSPQAWAGSQWSRKLLVVPIPEKELDPDYLVRTPEYLIEPKLYRVNGKLSPVASGNMDFQLITSPAHHFLPFTMRSILWLKQY